ncbi:MAG TPA: VIT domain-containing protein [Gemmatimonadales bacterium]|nr:VIT domain-containing protein [Gemmatimonadales bacterium]
MRTSRVLGAAVFLCTISSALLAQGWIDPERPVPQVSNGPIERLRSAVQVSVSGRIARVTVEEWFRNNGPVLNEGIYHFPLPGEAVFSSYSLWQGDQELRGEAMDAAQARSIYEAIVRQKRDPALIELAGQGLIRARVFPIGPGETRKITLKYTQLLDRAGDAWRFRYLGDRNRQTAPRSFRLEVDSAARFGDPYSPTHQVQVTRHDNRLEVTLAEGSAATGDFELLLPLARGLIGLSLMPHHPAGEDGYFMLLLAPGAAAEATVLRRDLVAVIDVSGSMSGEKIQQAKSALIQLLGTLREGDRFRLVAFSGGVRRYAQGWTGVTTDARHDAESWIRSLDAEGGTNIAGALTEAFAQAPAEQSLGVVVFLTDGQASTGETDPERIVASAEQGRGKFRVFSFGIGDDVNTYLLDRLTERARGTTEYIRPGENIERAVGALAAKVASPVLTDVTIAAGSGIELYDMQPGNLPDLFAGDEMVVFGRYRGVGSGEWSVTVQGRRNGRQEEFRTSVRERENDDARYIEQLWAARRAGALSREIRLRGQTRELMDALKQLALRYGILTEYTSYLVQEPNVALRRQAENRVMQAPAAAPADQAGAASVGRATRERSMADALRLEEVVVTGTVNASALDEMRRARSGINPTQRVGGRLFIMRDSTWTDLGHGDSLRVVSIAPYSEAYFALLKALPDLREAAALEPAVLVAGRRASIKIGEGGKTRWNPGELERLVRDFRS